MEADAEQLFSLSQMLHDRNFLEWYTSDEFTRYINGVYIFLMLGLAQAMQGISC